MKDNQKVRVQLAGDDAWYSGVVINARKEWVELSDYPHPLAAPCPLIADESNIIDWRPE